MKLMVSSILHDTSVPCIVCGTETLLNTGVSDLHNCMCACCIQGLWIIVELTLALVLAQSSWINYGVLGQKPLYWTVDIPLPTAFVTIPGMLV